MSGSVNKVILVGNLGREPDIRTTQSGQKIANLSIATSESWKDKGSGERKERTEWHRVSVYNESLAGICERYLKKGSKVYLEGQLETRKWQDKDGQDKYSTEVVLRPFTGVLTMLDGAGGGNGGGSSSGGGNYGGGSSSRNEYDQSAPSMPDYGSSSKIDDMEDDIPF